MSTVLGVDARVLQRHQRMEVGGGDERQADLLPFRSASEFTPEPLRATSASASLMLSSTQKTSIGTPCDSAAAMGDEPASPIWMAPEASARTTSAPLPSLR